MGLCLLSNAHLTVIVNNLGVDGGLFERDNPRNLVDHLDANWHPDETQIQQPSDGQPDSTCPPADENEPHGSCCDGYTRSIARTRNQSCDCLSKTVSVSVSEYQNRLVRIQAKILTGSHRDYITGSRFDRLRGGCDARNIRCIVGTSKGRYVTSSA